MEPNGQQLPTSSYDADELNLAQIVRFFLRHWRLICGTALLAGLTTALSMALFVPRSYEASATLVIVSLKLSSNEFQKRYDEVATRWDEKLLTVKNETADLLAA